MPYFSQEAEETLKELPNIVRDYERNSLRNAHYTEEEFIKGLTSNEPNEVIAALDALRDVEIKPYLIYVSKILLSFPKQSVRSFALLLLVHKEFSKAVKFNHMGKVIEVVPSELKPPFVNSEFSDLNERLLSKFKDSSLTMNAIQILSTYLIYIYPEEIDFNDPMLLEALHIITAKYLKQHYISDFTNECESLVNDISNALNDF